MDKACLVSSFDMVNVADLDLLGQVRRRCDEMVVLVLGDELVHRFHDRPAVVPQQERFELVRSLRQSGDVRLVTGMEQLEQLDCPVYTDEEALGAVAELLQPARRSASRHLRHALAHGAGEEVVA